MAALQFEINSLGKNIMALSMSLANYQKKMLQFEIKHYGIDHDHGGSTIVLNIYMGSVAAVF